jgi:hypothetical protein
VKDSILENVQEGDDGGVELAEYNKMLGKIARLEINEHVSEDDPEWLPEQERIGRSYVLKAYKKAGSLVRKIIDLYFTEGVDKALSKEHIERGVGQVINVANYDRWSLDKHKMFKILIKSGQKYKICPQIASMFSK